ncbi:MAG: hypothetical protein HYW26_02415 [Candidatus Aenigmarchaeota archaeon]|nr:hypothetical protein [Candidatus Aenigmarchaeota archaeon]
MPIAGNPLGDSNPDPIRWDISTAMLVLAKYKDTNGAYVPDEEETASLAKAVDYLRTGLRPRVDPFSTVIEADELRAYAVIDRAASREGFTREKLGTYTSMLEDLSKGNPLRHEFADGIMEFLSSVLRSSLEMEEEEERFRNIISGRGHEPYTDYFMNHQP